MKNNTNAFNNPPQLKTYRIFCAALALIVCLVTILHLLVPSAQAEDLNSLKDRYDTLEEQLKQSKAAYNQANANYADSEAKVLQLQKQADALKEQQRLLSQQNAVLNEKIEASAAKVEQLNNQIVSTKSNIETNSAEKKRVEKEIDTSSQLLMDRLRANYMAGTATWLEVFMQSQSMQDFLTRSELFSRVAENDRALIDKLEEKSTQLAKILEELEIKKSELEKSQKQATQVRNELYSQKSELNKNIANINAKQNEYEENVALIKTEMTALKKNSEALKIQQERIANDMAALESEIASAIAAANNKQENDTNEESQSDQGTSENLIMPLEKGTSYYVSCKFGPRINPITNQSEVHTGTDFAVAWGTPVIAAASGTVILSKYNSAYGYYIIIDHGGGLFTLYAHNTKLLAPVGRKVSQGERIALSGSTGWSTGPHVHFEVHVRGADGVSRAVDPQDGYI